MWKQWIVHNFWCCSTGYSIILLKGWNERLCKVFLRKKERNEAEHGESTIDCMHILVIPLRSIDGVWYPVFAPNCKQRIGLLPLPLRSNHSQHTLHVIESGEFTPQWLPIQFDLEQNHILNWTDSNQFKTDSIGTSFDCRRNESGSIQIESGSKLDYFASVEGP